MNSTKIVPAIRRAVLKSAGQTQSNIPIEIVPGVAVAPRTVGDRWHYTTRTGIRIDHPSAYSSKGWSSMVYHASTRRVIVGEQWVAQA